MERTRWGGFKGLVFPLGLLTAWFIFGYTGKLNQQILPSPGEVLSAFRYLCRDGLLWSHLGSSLVRVFGGFAFAALVGVPLGLIMGCVPQSQTWFGPTLHFLRQVPPTALIPLFLLWFGIGEAPKLAVIFYAALFPIVVNAARGVQEIPGMYWEVSRALCLSPWKTLKYLVIPGSWGFVFTGLRLGMGMSWRAIVAAEMLASASGVGYLVMTARSLARVDEMFVGILVIGFMGILIDAAVITIQNHFVPSWRSVQGTRRSEKGGTTAPRTAPSLQEL